MLTVGVTELEQVGSGVSTAMAAACPEDDEETKKVCVFKQFAVSLPPDLCFSFRVGERVKRGPVSEALICPCPRCKRLSEGITG